MTYGWLVGEVIRRISGRSVGAFFADEVAGPLGLEFWIGLPDDQQDRVAPLTNRGIRAGGNGDEDEPNPADTLGGLVEQLEALLGPGSLLAKALGGAPTMPLVADGTFNRPDLRAAGRIAAVFARLAVDTRSGRGRE